MTHCPTPDQLRELLAEQLTGADAETIELHLESCPRCQQVLEELTANSDLRAGRLPAPAEGSPSHSGLGSSSQLRASASDTLDDAPSSGRAHSQAESRQHYTVSRLHAQGGIGEVWLAHDGELGREVALKGLRPERADNPVVVARFLEEARITGQLEHPNIVPVYALAQGARPFYTMRFIHGRTLNDAIESYHHDRQAGRAGPLELRNLLGAFVSVGNAIAYAHSRRVIHRDLKPRNVVLGDFGEVVVLDWGLAKVLGGEDGKPGLAPVTLGQDGSRDQTVQGQVMGTPSYMAPEQAEGRLADVNERSDVYGLGALLYEVLTGRPPFTGADARQVLQQVIAAPPVPPRQIAPSVPPALEAVCLKALAKKPEARYPSARDLSQEVQRWLADEPVAAYPEPLSVKARRWVGRHRTLTGSAVAAVLVAAVSLAVATVFLKSANERERRSRARAEANFKLAHDAVDRYFTRVSTSEKLKAHGLEKLRRDLLLEARDFYERFLEEHGDEPGLRDERAQAYWRLAKISAEIGRTEDADRYFPEAVSSAETLARDHPSEPDYQRQWAIVLHDAALHHYHTGKIDLARETMEQALGIRERLVKDHPDSDDQREGLARTLHDLGTLYAETGRRPDAQAAYQRALALDKQLTEGHPKNATYREMWATHLYSLGHLHLASGRPSEGLAAVEESRDLRADLAERFPAVPGYQERLARSFLELGTHYVRAGQLTDSKKSLEKAIALFDRLAFEHPDVLDYREGLGRALHDLGTLYLDTSQWPEAKVALERALPLYEELVRAQPRSPTYRDMCALALYNVGRLHEANGRLKQAVEAMEKSRDLGKELVGDFPKVPAYRDRLGRALIELGGLYVHAGQPKRGLETLGEAVALYERLAQDHAEVLRFQDGRGRSRSDLGVAHQRVGNKEQAQAHLGKALQIYEELTSKHPTLHDFRSSLAHAHIALGELFRTAGQLPRARDSFAAALPITEGLVKEQPKVPRYRAQWISCRLNLAATRASLGDHARATSDTEAVLKEKDLTPINLYDAVCVYALASAAVRKDEKRTETDRTMLAEEYAARAVVLLRQAVAKGYRDVNNIKTDSDVDALRSRPDFEKVLEELTVKPKVKGK
jgi:serine/threonine-protein kinase